MQDREIKARLRNFDAVWQRVRQGREEKPKAKLMPRRRRCCR